MMHRHFMFCGRRQAGGRLGSWFLRRMGKKLKLNGTQQAKLAGLENTLAISKDYVAHVRRERDAIVDDIFSQDSFDRDAALHLLNVPRLAFEEHAPSIVEAFGDFYDSLDGRQRDRLRGVWQKHLSRKRWWH